MRIRLIRRGFERLLWRRREIGLCIFKISRYSSFQKTGISSPTNLKLIPIAIGKKLKTIQSLLFRFGIFLIFVGLLCSRFAISLGMLFLFLNALLFQNNKEVRTAFFQNRILLALTSLFFVYFLTGIYSTDKTYFLERIRIVLPFLILPFAFAKNPITTAREKNQWLYFFFLLIVGTAIHTSGRIWFRYQTFQIIFENTNYIPAPINHVRYSLLIAFSIFIGWHLFRKYQFRYAFEKKMVLGCSIFLIFFLHLIGVRSGLLGFYLATLFLLFQKVKKQYLIVAFLILSGTFFIALISFPNFQNKVNRTKSTIYECFENYPISHLSDSGRIKSIKAGLEVGKKHFWLGIGLGDLKQNLTDYYQNNYPNSSNDILLPHNQFVFYFAFSGIVGCVLFCFVLLSSPSLLTSEIPKIIYSVVSKLL